MRRLSTGVALLCLLVPALAACGSDDDNGTDETGSVAVAGGFGEAPEVTYETPYTVTEISTEVLTEGDGETVAEGDLAFVNIYVGNGFSGKEATSSWTTEEPAEEPTTEGEKTEEKGKKGKADRPKKDKGGKDRKGADTEGADDAPEAEPTPQMVTVKPDATYKPIYEGILGKPVGSRVLVSSPGEDAFGLAGAEYNIGNEDTTVFVIDIVSKTAPQLDASGAKQPKNAPTVVEQDGKVTGLDFAKAPKKAGDDLRVLTMVEGDGPAVEEGDQVALRYLGQVWGGKKPFDTNYDADVPGVGGQPAVIAKGGLIDGWVEGLQGVKAGSRVMLVIPSELGYGKEGSGEDIPANADLVFVIDVLAVL